nr:MAG TPA: hypothetical protein [Ackermannviridae sp.]
MSFILCIRRSNIIYLIVYPLIFKTLLELK